MELRPFTRFIALNSWTELLRKPPEIACDVPRRTLSFERKFTQIGKCIMTRCKLLVPAAICALLVSGTGVVSACTGEELAKDAKDLS